MKKLNKDNKGFSLVELLVVIAIMVVLVGVLAPTLLGNIEKTREAKDIQAVDTLAGNVQAAMTDEKIYDAIIGTAGTGDHVYFDLYAGYAGTAFAAASYGEANTRLASALDGYLDKDNVYDATNKIKAFGSKSAKDGKKIIVDINVSTGSITVALSKSDTVDATALSDANVVKGAKSGNAFSVTR